MGEAGEGPGDERSPAEAAGDAGAPPAVSPEAAPYPRHWEADVLLRDGRAAHLRPITAADHALLVSFYAEVSPESKYLRFFAPMPRLSQRDVDRFTQVDHRDRVALVLTVGERMVAVGRFDVIEDGEAEVAFLVQDAHQGRGIAQLLLEHLAQAGREVGVRRFVAEVLPQNRTMIGVFRDAGYRVARHYEEGVMRLEFGIDTTDTSFGVMQDREHHAESVSIEKFFTARSVAIIGASRRQDTIGQTLVRNLVLGGYTGRVYAVNPAADAVAGMPSYDTVADIPDEVELAIVAVPAEKVADVVLDCAAKGVHGMVVISSGFAETGPQGRQRQRQLVGLARSYGLRLVGPNCLGIINTAGDMSLNASLSPIMPPRGRAGFFCQSGALGTAILEKVNNRGLGLSTFVSAGNRADVSGNDLLQYWEEDDATEVVLLYLESIGNPRKFSRIARRVSRRKPIVAVRSGRSTQGVPMGHAVRAIAAPQAAVDTMFSQAGVIGVDNLDEMFDVAQLVAHQPLPRGDRVAVVGNSDALSLLAADAAAATGLEVKATVQLGAEATAEDFEDALDDAIDDPEIDSVIAVYIPPLNTSGVAVANVLAAVGEQSDKPLVSSFLGAEGVPELLRIPDLAGATAGRGSVPSYPAVEAAVRALARVVEYAAWLTRTETEEEDEPPCDASTARKLATTVLMDDPAGRELDFGELHTLLGAYGIDLWEQVPVASVDEALAAGEKLAWGDGATAVLKATAEQVVLLPDLSHVVRDIEDAEQMRAAYASIVRAVGEPEVAQMVVQRCADPGVPVSVGSLEDPLFGPVVSFGISGALTELLADTAYAIPPISRAQAAVTVRAIRASPLLFGYRGTTAVDTASLEDLLWKVACLKNDLPQLRLVELPLVMVTENGTHVLTAAGRVQQVADARSDWFARRMTSPEGDTLG